MIQIGNWGVMYDDGEPCGNSVRQKRLKARYGYQQSIDEIGGAEAYFKDFLKNHLTEEDYPKEAKEKLKKEFAKYIESEVEIIKDRLEKRLSELY